MSTIEASLLALVLMAIGTIVCGTIKTGISPMMSSTQARKVMLRAIRDVDATSQNKTIIDLGSGWGTLLIRAAQQFPDKQFIGYELSLLPWLFSLACKYLLGLRNLTIHRQDFLKADFNQAGILLCYLFPKGMEVLKDKLEKEEVKDVSIISNTFALPDTEVHEVVKLNDFYGTPIYVYER